METNNRTTDDQTRDGNLGRGEAWLAEAQPPAHGADTHAGGVPAATRRRDDGTSPADRVEEGTTNTGSLVDLSSDSAAGGLIGAGISDDAAWQRDRSGFQEHFAARHPSADGETGQRAWNQAEPNYRYGYDAARSEQYQGRQFEEVEPELRRAYELRNQESGWDRLREEVRDGFNRFRDLA